MTLDPDWFITFHIDDTDQGLDGKYHICTTGCGCCSDYVHLTPVEYITLLGRMIRELDILMKRAIENDWEDFSVELLK